MRRIANGVNPSLAKAASHISTANSKWLSGKAQTNNQPNLDLKNKHFVNVKHDVGNTAAIKEKTLSESIT